mmetsp:Transcript_64273/g.144975  ORF Transcript_64273/g.144975 Transcript_64273/m.144975 type:complete len:177 (+) Transcript_64273:576-1106(+)
MAARVATEGLRNVSVVAATDRDPLPDSSPAEGTAEGTAEATVDATRVSMPLAGATEGGGGVDLALLCDVYHHLEYPKTVMRRLRKVMNQNSGRLVVIDFYRDSAKVTSRPPEWVMEHLRAGQDVFRSEILASGFVLVSEPEIPELRENYVMVFRPATDAELGAQLAAKPGAGWADS